MLGRRRKEEEGSEGGGRPSMVDNSDSHKFRISKAVCMTDIMVFLIVRCTYVIVMIVNVLAASSHQLTLTHGGFTSCTWELTKYHIIIKYINIPKS